MSNLALPPRPSKPLDHPVLPSDPEAGPSTGANVAIPPQRNLLEPDVRKMQPRPQLAEEEGRTFSRPVFARSIKVK